MAPSAILVTYMLPTKWSLLCPEMSLMSNIQFNIIVIVFLVSFDCGAHLICMAKSWICHQTLPAEQTGSSETKLQKLKLAHLWTFMFSHISEDITACNGSFPSQTHLVKLKNADVTLIQLMTQHISMRTTL